MKVDKQSYDILDELINDAKLLTEGNILSLHQEAQYKSTKQNKNKGAVMNKVIRQDDLNSVKHAWSNLKTMRKGKTHSHVIADISGSTMRFVYPSSDRLSCCGASDFKANHYHHCHLTGLEVDRGDSEKRGVCYDHDPRHHESFLVMYCRSCGKQKDILEKGKK
tara:strand:- start:51 stop:542 length:492 start_codon:yes stop_codon:yes gene_type:complete